MGERPEHPKIAVPEALRPDGPEIVFERIVDHDTDDKGDLWLRVRWFGFGPKDDTWEHSGNLPVAQVYKYCRQKGLLPQDLDRISIKVAEEGEVQEMQ